MILYIIININVFKLYISTCSHNDIITGRHCKYCSVTHFGHFNSPCMHQVSHQCRLGQPFQTACSMQVLVATCNVISIIKVKMHLVSWATLCHMPCMHVSKIINYAGIYTCKIKTRPFHLESCPISYFEIA